MRALVIYDICGNKARREVVKTLSGYGNRVQKSAFEVKGVTRKTFSHMLKDIERLGYDRTEDSIRIYMLEDAGAYRILGKSEEEADGKGAVII